MEILDIVDEKGVPIGKTIERAIAHAEGIRHRTSHVWLLKRSPEGVQILLQKRSKNKDSFPGCYDISSAGHIPAGEDFVPSALRELRIEGRGIARFCWSMRYALLRNVFRRFISRLQPCLIRQTGSIRIMVFGSWMLLLPERSIRP